MPKFRKKPVVVEAMRVPPVGSMGAHGVLDQWLQQNEGKRPCRYVGDKIEIHTLEGVMVAKVGDWIIKGVEGELSPIKDSIFKETYDPVEEFPIPVSPPRGLR